MLPEWIGANTVLIFVAILLNRLKYITHRNMLTAWIANISGVVLHEALHWLIGKILKARPTKFVLFPKSIKDPQTSKKIYILGHVEFDNLRWYNSAPAALAPLLILPIAVAVEANAYFLFGDEWWSPLGYILTMIVLIDNALPSSVDWALAIQNTLPSIFYISAFMGACIYLLNGDMPAWITDWYVLVEYFKDIAASILDMSASPKLPSGLWKE